MRGERVERVERVVVVSMHSRLATGSLRNDASVLVVVANIAYPFRPRRRNNVEDVRRVKPTLPARHVAKIRRAELFTPPAAHAFE